MPIDFPLPSPVVSAFGARSTALDVVAGCPLHKRHAIVTGGASGLGLETSKALAFAGAHVTLAVRNLTQGDTVARGLRAAFPHAAISVAQLDLADIASVRSFATGWLATGATLDILINNAAIMACPLTRTVQGWEAQFATNHLGHFALTTALLPALFRAGAATGDARVVCLSSAGHKIADVDFDDIHYERRDYNKWNAYGQAKSANALMALGLHLKYAARHVTANAVHPGGIMTGLQKYLPMEEMRAAGWLKADGTPLDIFKTPAQGASTSVWAASAPELRGRGGLYLEDCRQGLPAESNNRISGYLPHIADPAAALRLWEVSERMLSAPDN
ncbi:MAG: SDR family NAD(P)-dependent oxidoreductase [Pseudomonadota bacterium]|uniref:SDR family NAD(P)-dependent oxidoreductase n=1 Tax=Polaromonas sp. TaxID=1869339 RepID=UPI001844E50A|nr:SDR family NAD(P)-dependent oxidoreductase [Polaromonas sp.]MBA3592335.1 SDR family NAD(P)-dependent oxidoreductase [Polaromonas sp.]MDQ3272081.1 SDR family NAD(P)-dependent oxidoreductase [Pseudomonadota bacterium]